MKRLGIYVTQAEGAAVMEMINGGIGCISLEQFTKALEFDGLPREKKHTTEKKRPVVKRPAPAVEVTMEDTINIPKGELSDDHLMVKPNCVLA